MHGVTATIAGENNEVGWSLLHRALSSKIDLSKCHEADVCEGYEHPCERAPYQAITQRHETKYPSLDVQELHIKYKRSPGGDVFASPLFSVSMIAGNGKPTLFSLAHAQQTCVLGGTPNFSSCGKTTMFRYIFSYVPRCRKP